MIADSHLCDRGLVVENEIATLLGLTEDLKTAFPEAVIDSAKNITEAFGFLRRAKESGTPYDFGVLDLRLPELDATKEESDFSIAAKIREFWSDAIVIRISAHGDDEDVQPKTKRIEHFVPKDGDFHLTVIRELKRLLHERRIRRRFETLFAQREEFSGRGRIGDGGWSDRERSLYVAELCADASQHWECLSEPLQNQLKQVLGHTTVEQGGRTLHLLGVAQRPRLESTSSTVEEARQ